MANYSKLYREGDFLHSYTTLWATMAQVGVRCRIKYTPILERDGNYYKGAINYRIINQQERSEVMNHVSKKSSKKESCGKKEASS